MTEHSIEELKRQLEAARGRRIAAADAERAASKRYNDAIGADMLDKFAAMGGVIGVTKVRVPVTWGRLEGRADMSNGPYFVKGVTSRYGAMCFDLAKIKKDGTASNAACGCAPEAVIILPEDNA